MSSTTDPQTITARAVRVDITPKDPVPLFGYQGRTAGFTDVADPLEANIALFSDGAGPRVALIAIDTLFAGDLEARIHTALGASQDLVVICCASHTHYAPCLDAGKPGIGTVDPAYRDHVVTCLADGVAQLLAQPGRPVALTQSGPQTSDTGLAINRRARRYGLSRKAPFFARRTMIAPNRDAPGRFPLQVLSLQAGDTPLAVFWHWACHPVSAARSDLVSASFPGAVRAAFRDTLGLPDLPVIFLQGFCGDVRPTVGIRRPSLREALVSFPGEVFGTPSEEAYAAWQDQVATAALAALAACGPGQALNGPLIYDEAHVPLAKLMPGTTADKTLDLAVLRLGQALSLTLVSAEIVHAYDTAIAQTQGPQDLRVGYRGDCFGYLPNDRQLPEGGYEVDGFLKAFSLDRGFAPGLDATVMDAIGGLAAAPVPNGVPS